MHLVLSCIRPSQELIDKKILSHLDALLIYNVIELSVFSVKHLLFIVVF